MTVLMEEVKVTKESREVAKCFEGIFETAKRKLEDGFQAGEDISAIFAENLTALMTALSGMDQLDDEYREDLEAFLNSWMLLGTKIAGSFSKKEVVEA